MASIPSSPLVSNGLRGVGSNRAAVVLAVPAAQTTPAPVSRSGAGALALADEVREESWQAVDALHKLGLQVVMITGDAHTVAESVAAQLGIDRVFAGVRPRGQGREGGAAAGRRP